MVVQLNSCCNADKSVMSSSAKKEFYLTIVRHGQTIANESKVIQGFSDTPLTTSGQEQIKLLRNYLSKEAELQFNRIYSSDLPRAYETCKLLTQSYTVAEEDTSNKEVNGRTIIKKDVRLRERKYGPFEGKLIAALQQEAYQKGFNETNFSQYTPNGAESMEQVIKRIETFCFETLFIESQQDDEVLIVTHWGTIKELLKIFQPFTCNSIRKEHLVETPNVAMSRFRIKCSYSNDLNGTSQGNSKLYDSIQSVVSASRIIPEVEIIYLHQTPHLREGQVTVNIKTQLE